MSDELKKTKSVSKKTSLKASYDEVFNSNAGDEVLQHLMKISGISNFVNCPTNESHWINFGERRLVFSILKMLGKDPNVILEHAKQNSQKTYENYNG